MKKPTQPLKGIELQKQLLNKAIKPTTNPLEQQKNQDRFDTLQKLNQTTTGPITTSTTVTKVGGKSTLGGLEGRPDTSTIPADTNVYRVDQTAIDAAAGPSNEAISWYAKSKGMNAATYNKILEKNPELAAKIKQQYADYQAANQEPVATYGEIGQANIQADYDANIAAELGLTGEAKGYTSMEEYFKDQYAALQEQTALQKEQLDLQKTQLGEQTSDQRNIAEGQVEAASGLAGDREGVTSTSNLSAYDRLKEVTSTQISRLQRDQDMSMKAIEQAKTDLARAERAGNTELAAQMRQKLLAAESAAQATETAYITALTAQSTEERARQAQQAQNVESFATLVQQGTEMDYNTISSLASQYGLPTDMLMGYYQGAQNIRNNKALDNDMKEAELAKLNQDLSDQVKGLRTTEAKNIDYLTQLRQMGASEEVIAAFKSAAGITDYADPLTQAELEYQNLENEIKRKQMNGEPVSVSDYEILFDLQQKMNESTGGGGSAYVSSSIDGISMEYAGGQLNVTLPTNPDGTLKAYQCGEFVNRAWGLTSGGTGGFGSTASDKRDLVSRNGFFTKDKSFTELMSMVKPGMAFSSYAGDTDHTGLIISAPDVNGNYMTLEANVGDDNPYVSDPPIYKTRNIKDQDVYGFVYPPNGQIIAGSNTSASTLKELPEEDQKAVKEQMTSFNSNSTVKNFNTSKEGYDFISSIDVNTENPADDIAIIYALAKALDPDSVVREGEYATVSKYVQNWADQFGFDAKRIFSNTVFLTPEARQSILDTVGSRFEASRQNYNRVRGSYVQTLTDVYGVPNADAYFIDYDAESTPTQPEVDPHVVTYDSYEYTNDGDYQELIQLFVPSGIGSANPNK